MRVLPRFYGQHVIIGYTQSGYGAAKQGIPPILMASLTFILAAMPFAFATGPGSGAQNAISIDLLGDIAATTVFVLFFAPFFFHWVMRSKEGKQGH